MFKIAINAGHGKNTAGKRCLKSIDPNETREYTLNARICDMLESTFAEYDGIEVLRIDDGSELSISARANKANGWGADFYLSIHHNAGINGGTGGGVEAYVYTSPSQAAVEWQKALYDAVIKYTGLSGNRSQPLRKKNLGELRQTDMPAVLLECGYMDSTTDTPIILTKEHAAKCAAAIVEVITARAGLVKKNTPTPAPTPENDILLWQKAAIADGFSFPRYGADGIWGAECEAVAKKAVCKKQSAGYKNKNLTRIIQGKVGVTVDGKFGKNTRAAVIEWQRQMGLNPDGVVGINTWKRMLMRNA